MIDGDEKGYWSEARLIRCALAILIAVAVAAVPVIQNDIEWKSMLLRGDFPGFFGPATIISQGAGQHLYDRPLQHAVQQQIWPSMRGEVLVSVYPAFVPVIISPLAHLPMIWAKAFFALVSLLGIMVFALTGFPPELRGRLSFASRSLLLLVFPPLLVSVVGGQNTGITLGLLGVMLYGIRSGEQKKEALTGVALALLLYKPQFGALMFLPFLLWGQWRVLCAAAITAVVLAMLPMPWTGINWFEPWLRSLAAFAPENFRMNSPRMISPSAFIVSAFGVSGFTMACGLALTALLYLWSLASAVMAERGSRAGAFAVFAMTVAFLSPQALFYDLGIIAPLLVAAVIPGDDRAAWSYFAWAAAAAAAFFLLEESRFPIYFFLGGALLIEKLRDVNVRSRLSR